MLLCILLQQLASDSGRLPKNGYAGCSCEYVTVPVAGTWPPRPHRVPLLGQAPHWEGVRGGGAPKEPLPHASLAPPCTDLSAASGRREHAGSQQTALAGRAQGGFCRGEGGSLNWERRLGTHCFGTLGDREVSKQISSRLCCVLMLQKHLVLKMPRYSNSIKMF